MHRADTGDDVRARWLSPSTTGGTRRDEAMRALGVARETGAPVALHDLRGIDLIREDLSGLDLSRCTLVGADLSHARLPGARLSGCDLSSAVLHQADLRGANLTGARLREADLSGAHFEKAVMVEADLGRSRVHGACFRDADLRRSKLRGLHGYDRASWVGADVRDIDFTGAYLLRRFMRDENYLYEFRTRGRLALVFYWLWWITSDCGRSAVRWFLFTALVALALAGLYTLVDIDWGPSQNAFSPIYFSIVTLTTLGYGDMLPSSTVAQVLTTVEVVMGYLGLGGMLSILANEMARRAD